MNATSLNASRRRSKMLVSAAAKMTASAGAFAVVFGAMAYAHSAMNESLCRGVRMVMGVSVLGAVIGLIAGGGIVLMSGTRGAISAASLSRVLLAALVLGAVCAAIGVPLGISIGEARLAAFVPAMLGFAGVVVGIATGTIYVAGEAEDEEQTAATPRVKKIAVRADHSVRRERRANVRPRETSSVRRILQQMR